MLKQLNIIEAKELTIHQTPSADKLAFSYHPRYKKLEEPISKDVKDSLESNTKKFVAGEISRNEFEFVLREHKINPEIPTILKQINASVSSQGNFRVLLGELKRNLDSLTDQLPQDKVKMPTVPRSKQDHMGEDFEGDGVVYVSNDKLCLLK